MSDKKTNKSFKEYYKEYCKNRIQIFPRPAIFEILSGEALIWNNVNKKGAPMEQKTAMDVLESYCYNILSEAQRKMYRDTYKAYLEKINTDK